MTAMMARVGSPSTPDATPMSLAVRPFLKWAGGKRQLLPELSRFHQSEFGTYGEPFLGSGALFFDLHARGRLKGHRVVLVDSNPDFIGCWLAIRNEPERVIRGLRRLARAHEDDPRSCYYRVRDGRFNPTRRRLFAEGRARADRYTPGLAAMLIYLNRTGFNVPLGRYVNPRVCDSANLRRVALALANDGVTVRDDRFETVCDWAQSGDFLYFDPPYAPVSATSFFTGSTPGGFSSDDQQRLQRVVSELARRGCRVLLSNSAAPEISALYVDNVPARAAGLRAYRVSVRRAINAKVSARGPVDEYLITNIPPRD